jgi:hypothetical protein
MKVELTLPHPDLKNQEEIAKWMRNHPSSPTLIILHTPPSSQSIFGFEVEKQSSRYMQLSLIYE